MFGIFEIPTAVASNIQTLVVCRFLAGVFGSAPLTIVGGALADFWNPVDRGIAVAIFSVSTFLGPTMGPIVGGFLTENESLGWRWTSWITIILTAGFGLFGFLVYPESFAPVLLQRREKRRRHETKDGAIYAAHDGNRVNLRQIGEKYLSRPLIMLVKEPILLLVTIYMSFIYVSRSLPYRLERLLTVIGHPVPVFRSLPDLLPGAARLVTWCRIASLHRRHVRSRLWRVRHLLFYKDSLREDCQGKGTCSTRGASHSYDDRRWLSTNRIVLVCVDFLASNFSLASDHCGSSYWDG